MLTRGRCKGSVLVHMRDFVERHHGNRAWSDALERLDPEDRAVLEGIIIVGGWYPVRVWNNLLAAFLPTAYVDVERGMGELAAFIADRDLSTLYKMILKMGTPEFLVRRTESLWGRYFDEGKFTAEEVEPGRWKLTLTAPNAVDRAPDHFTCGPGVCAWLEMGLRRTGVEGSVRHVRCRFGGGERCEYDVAW